MYTANKLVLGGVVVSGETLLISLQKETVGNVGFCAWKPFPSVYLAVSTLASNQVSVV